MIEARELTKMWSATAGLRPVSFTVADGEFVVVRGRSGSGKSTLLALLGGLCPADGGSGVVSMGSAIVMVRGSRLMGSSDIRSKS